MSSYDGETVSHLVSFGYSLIWAMIDDAVFASLVRLSRSEAVLSRW
jgi:hypothetical protein